MYKSHPSTLSLSKDVLDSCIVLFASPTMLSSSAKLSDAMRTLLDCETNGDACVGTIASRWAAGGVGDRADSVVVAEDTAWRVLTAITRLEAAPNNKLPITIT